MTTSFHVSTSSSTLSLNYLPTQPLIHPSTHLYFHSSIHLCNNDQLSGYHTLGNEPGASKAKVGLPRRHHQARIFLQVQEVQEMPGRSLGQEDPLEEEMATQSSILAWRIPWTEEPGRLQSMASQRGIEHAHTQGRDE